MTDRTKWTEQLLSHDVENAEMRRRYERAKQGLHERTSHKLPLLIHGLISAIGCIGGLSIGSLALTEPDSTPATTRLFLLLLASFSMSWAILFGYAIKRRWPLAGPQCIASAYMAFGFTLTTAVVLLLLCAMKGASVVSISMTGVALLLVVIAAVLLILTKVQQSENRLRIDILSVELRLAKLATNDR